MRKHSAVWNPPPSGVGRFKHPIHITIEFFDGNKDDSRVSWARRIADYVWLIRVNETDSGSGADLLSSTAHELGHVLANEFNLPHASADPRWLKVPFGYLPHEDRKVIAAEEEAWDVAEAIFLLLQDRRYCMGQYTALSAKEES